MRMKQLYTCYVKNTGLKTLGGSVSKTYENWRQQLISGLAHAEAVIDFGDDEHLVLGNDDDDDECNRITDYEELERQQQMVWGEVATKMANLQKSMEEQLQDGRRGELIREGITVAIVGPPNAGKSSRTFSAKFRCNIYTHKCIYTNA